MPMDEGVMMYEDEVGPLTSFRVDEEIIDEDLVVDVI